VRNILGGYWPIMRLELQELGSGNKIACWPSIGGLWIHEHIHPVMLDYLDLPLFPIQRSLQIQ
jgi:hypothetical protein